MAPMLSKTQKKIQELQETIDKEFSEACAVYEGTVRIATIKEVEDRLSRNLAAYEAVKILNLEDYSYEQDAQLREKKYAQGQRHAAGIVALLEYAHMNPKATPRDLQKLGIELPNENFTPEAIIMIARCARIYEKFAEEKPRLTGALLQLVTKA